MYDHFTGLSLWDHKAYLSLVMLTHRVIVFLSGLFPTYLDLKYQYLLVLPSSPSLPPESFPI